MAEAKVAIYLFTIYLHGCDWLFFEIYVTKQAQETYNAIVTHKNLCLQDTESVKKYYSDG